MAEISQYERCVLQDIRQLGSIPKDLAVRRWGVTLISLAERGLIEAQDDGHWRISAAGLRLLQPPPSAAMEVEARLDTWASAVLVELVRSGSGDPAPPDRLAGYAYSAAAAMERARTATLRALQEERAT